MTTRKATARPKSRPIRVLARLLGGRPRPETTCDGWQYQQPGGDFGMPLIHASDRYCWRCAPERLPC